MKKISLILALILITSSLSCALTGVAYAAESNIYSFVMDDLQKDGDFSELEYLAVDDDYSLHVIQVAESSDGELFVYVYQPYGNSRGLLASSITLARGKSGKNYNWSQDLSFVNYKLTYLNSADVFFKYKITNFELSSDDVRYYNVAAIMRPWDSAIDDPAPNGNTISETAYEVNRLWTVTTEGDSVSYDMQETETIRITSKVVGYVNYSDGWKMSFGSTTTGATSAHFVAFSTDWQIDRLMEVEVSFNTQDVQYKWCNNFAHFWHYKQKYDYVKDKVVPHDNIVLRDSDNAANSAGLSFADKHEWARIMTAADFLAYHDDENGEYQLMTDDKENIKKQQWVLSFYETPIYEQSDIGWSLVLSAPIMLLWSGEATLKYTEVYDLVILRMMFQKDGTTYNLGVVDNKQTGSGKPSNISNTIAELKDVLAQVTGFFNKAEVFFKWLGEHWWYILIGLAVIAVVVSLIVAFFKFGFKVVMRAIGFVLWWMFKIIFYVVTCPFWLIWLIVRAVKKNKQ